MELIQLLKSVGILISHLMIVRGKNRKDLQHLITSPGSTLLDTFDILDDPLRRFILLLPAFQGDRAAEVLFLRPLLLLESVLYLLTPTVLPVDDVWEHRIAHHNKVYSTTERKHICLVVRVELITQTW